jgi:hypothetical protein
VDQWDFYPLAFEISNIDHVPERERTIKEKRGSGSDLRA